MNYVLILTIIHSFGAVDVQRIDDGYQTYQQCAEDAVGRVETLRVLNPGNEIKWQCQSEFRGER